MKLLCWLKWNLSYVLHTEHLYRIAQKCIQSSVPFLARINKLFLRRRLRNKTNTEWYVNMYLCYYQQFAFARLCELYVVITSLCLIAFEGSFTESFQSTFESTYIFDIHHEFHNSITLYLKKYFLLFILNLLMIISFGSS